MLSSLEHWLEPIEKDEVLRMKYAAHLRSGAITIQRNPVLWKIASHHSESKVWKIDTICNKERREICFFFKDSEIQSVWHKNTYIWK